MHKTLQENQQSYHGGRLNTVVQSPDKVMVQDISGLMQKNQLIK